MVIIREPKELQKLALATKRAGKRIGLVPTMGFLHAGHLSLIDEAKKRAKQVALVKRVIDEYCPEAKISP